MRNEKLDKSFIKAIFGELKITDVSIVDIIKKYMLDRKIINSDQAHFTVEWRNIIKEIVDYDKYNETEINFPIMVWYAKTKHNKTISGLKLFYNLSHSEIIF